jgi:hypothetical protein
MSFVAATLTDFVAVHWSLAECMSYWIGLSIAISSLPKVTKLFFIGLPA